MWLLNIFLCNLLRLVVNVNVVPSSPMLGTLIMEAALSSEALVLTAATRRNITEDGNLNSYHRGNLKYRLLQMVLKEVRSAKKQLGA
jgi:hypothetical protein